MITDIYTKRRGEVYFSETQVEQNDEILIYVQKIKMILFTTKGEIVGDVNFGSNLEKLLFRKNLSAEQITGQLEQQIAIYCEEYNYIDTKIGVTFNKYPRYEEVVLQIKINGLDVFTIKAAQ